MMLRCAFLFMFSLILASTVSANERFYAAMARGDLQAALHVLRTEEAYPSLDSPRLKTVLAALPADKATAILTVIQARMLSQDENESSTQLDGRDRGNSRSMNPKQVEAAAAQLPEGLRPVFWFAVEFGQSINRSPQ